MVWCVYIWSLNQPLDVAVIIILQGLLLSWTPVCASVCLSVWHCGVSFEVCGCDVFVVIMSLQCVLVCDIYVCDSKVCPVCAGAVCVCVWVFCACCQCAPTLSWWEYPECRQRASTGVTVVTVKRATGSDSWWKTSRYWCTSEHMQQGPGEKTIPAPLRPPLHTHTHTHTHTLVLEITEVTGGVGILFVPGEQRLLWHVQFDRVFPFVVIDEGHLYCILSIALTQQGTSGVL